ncbi:MAG: tRNA (N6-threonylcarbamoyladenosine(37)-N6)-methyltransferase TrmO, partial [Bdellovibrionota bacterium]|nr:tRNA (N6-threonylcarbamoyladenosine(37)-N6)-methyltransferase TrmO [Bdellovibrionota bacterium]
IGYVESDLKFKSESPTQGTYVENSVAKIVLKAGSNFEQALEGLEDYERIWVIYQFHKNDNWKPKVNVPRLESEKKGVFATRSPYRPNSIGISCVKLLAIKGRELEIAESDILDSSPILDIKPYINYSDSFLTKQPDWLEKAEEEEFQIFIPEYMQKKIQYLEKVGKLNLRQFIDTQLRFAPLNKDRKRIEILEDTEAGIKAKIGFRTWRLEYNIDQENLKVFMLNLYSAYRKEELKEGEEDPYGDKSIHRKFNKKFG